MESRHSRSVLRTVQPSKLCMFATLCWPLCIEFVASRTASSATSCSANNYCTQYTIPLIFSVPLPLRTQRRCPKPWLDRSFGTTVTVLTSHCSIWSIPCVSPPSATKLLRCGVVLRFPQVNFKFHFHFRYSITIYACYPFVRHEKPTLATTH